MLETIKRGASVAKKPHICDLCRAEIKVKEKYLWQFNKLDGETYTFKTHIHCQAIADKLRMYREVQEYGLTDEDFHEYIVNEFDKYSLSANSFEEKLKIVKERNGITN